MTPSSRRPGTPPGRTQATSNWRASPLVPGALRRRWPIWTRALGRNGRHHGARHLQAAILRRLARQRRLSQALATGLALDRMNYGLHYEQYLLTGDDAYRALLQDNVHTYCELALDYAHAGLWR